MQSHNHILAQESQAFDILHRAGIPINKSSFPTRYHNEALLRTCPSFPSANGATHSTINLAMAKAYSPLEASRAQIAGALIHIMFTNPAEFLAAMHSPEVRSLVEEATFFDWRNHAQRLQQFAKKTTEETV